MSLLDEIRNLFSESSSEQLGKREAPPVPEPEPIRVVEVDVKDLMIERRNGSLPLLLDCREPFEWKQARIPGSLHMPMNTIPSRLAELDKEADIVVVCAHGVRSFSVTGFLVENGFAARSLQGGLVMWQVQGGEVESDY